MDGGVTFPASKQDDRKTFGQRKKRVLVKREIPERPKAPERPVRKVERKRRVPLLSRFGVLVVDPPKREIVRVPVAANSQSTNWFRPVANMPGGKTRMRAELVTRTETAEGVPRRQRRLSTSGSGPYISSEGKVLYSPFLIWLDELFTTKPGGWSRPAEVAGPHEIASRRPPGALRGRTLPKRKVIVGTPRQR